MEINLLKETILNYYNNVIKEFNFNNEYWERNLFSCYDENQIKTFLYEVFKTKNEIINNVEIYNLQNFQEKFLKVLNTNQENEFKSTKYVEGHWFVIFEFKNQENEYIKYCQIFAEDVFRNAIVLQDLTLFKDVLKTFYLIREKEHLEKCLEDLEKQDEIVNLLNKKYLEDELLLIEDNLIKTIPLYVNKINKYSFDLNLLKYQILENNIKDRVYISEDYQAYVSIEDFYKNELNKNKEIQEFLANKEIKFSFYSIKTNLYVIISCQLFKTFKQKEEFFKLKIFVNVTNNEK